MTTAPRTATIKTVPRGSWNHQIGALGEPGAGKTQWLVRRALALASSTPCYLVAHDPEYGIPSRLHDGAQTYVKRHDTCEQARHAILSDPARFHVVMCSDATEVVRLAHTLGQDSLTRGRGHSGVPVLVLVDEVVNCDEMGAGHLGATLKEAVSVRRHRHTGILWGTQSPALVHYQYLALGTELAVFRLSSLEALKRLEKHAGFDGQKIETIRNLPDHAYLLKIGNKITGPHRS